MNRSSIQSPPYSPGGREMLWMTRREMRSPSGRSSKWGDSLLINPEAVQPVPQRPERDAEQLRGGCLVEARGFEGLGDRFALDGVEEVVERKAAGAERAVERRHALLRARLRE